MTKVKLLMLVSVFSLFAETTDGMKPFFPLPQINVPDSSVVPVSRSTWTVGEDQIIKDWVAEHGAKDWAQLAELLPGKNYRQCSARWNKVLDPSLVKGAWTAEEDQVITSHVEQFGERLWLRLAERLPGRTGKQCRERWKNHLNPNPSFGRPWTLQEDEQLIELHEQLGNKWEKIAALMPNRSDQTIKNRWNNTLKKKCLKENSSELTHVHPIANLSENVSTLEPVISQEPPMINLSENTWTSGEDALLMELHKKCGPKWTKIIPHMPDRTDVESQNRYLTLLSEEKGWRETKQAIRINLLIQK